MAMAQRPRWCIPVAAGARIVSAQEGFSPAAEPGRRCGVEAGELRRARCSRLFAGMPQRRFRAGAGMGPRAASFSAAAGRARRPCRRGGRLLPAAFIAFAALMSQPDPTHAPAMGPTPSAILLRGFRNRARWAARGSGGRRLRGWAGVWRVLATAPHTPGRDERRTGARLAAMSKWIRVQKITPWVRGR